MTSSPPSKPSNSRRWFAAGLFFVMATAIGIEGIARKMQLDLVPEVGMQMIRSDVRPREMDGVNLLSLDYIPSGFDIVDGELRSRFGTCRLNANIPTLLALGDSVTVSSSYVEGKTEEQLAWPTFVAEALGMQLCVFAEAGFHPTDIAMFLDAMGPRLSPTETVMVLCHNDINDQGPRHVTRRQGDWAIVAEPQSHLVHLPTFWPWLGARSEAYRFFSYRLAGMLKSGEQWENPNHQSRQTAPALRRITALDPLLVYVPEINERWSMPPSDEVERGTGGIPLLMLPRPEDPLSLRRSPDDEVHFNAEGHQWLAQFIVAELQRKNQP